MLDLQTNAAARMCDGLSRRSFLRIGSLGLAGLSLADLLWASSQSNSNPSYFKDRSVILLFLGGGPSQHETFDPKPEGPDTSTSCAGHIPTALPGVRFASYLPKVAKFADRLSIVRSFQTNHAEHNGAHKQIMTGDLTVKDGKPINEPGLGAVCARVWGSVHPQTGMPRHAMIPPTTRHLGKASGFAGAYDSVVEGAQSAWLSKAYSPFQMHVPMSEGVQQAKKRKSSEPEPKTILDDLLPNLTNPQLEDRLDLLGQLDRFDRRVDAFRLMDGVDEYTEQAIGVLRGGAVRKALDLSLEDPKVLAAYDTEAFRNYKCDDNSKFLRDGPSIGISLGRQLLMARRLCEAGCGFVTVIHANWDFHARKGIPNIPEGMSVLAPPLDHAMAAFLKDVADRGLSEKILLVVTGEFGRTPKLDKNAGRHHWPRICPLVFAGGGLQHGQVIGQSDQRGGEPATEPYTIADLHSTILHTLFDVGQLRLDASLPRKFLARMEEGRPIRELF